MGLSDSELQSSPLTGPLYDFMGGTSYGRNSLVTDDQQATNKQYGQSGRDAMNSMYSNALNPRSAYQSMGNFDGQFNDMVANPALNQLGQQIKNLGHTNERFSGGQQMRINSAVDQTNNNLSQFRFDMLNKQRQMQLNDMDQALNNQYSTLAQLGQYGSNAMQQNLFENSMSSQPGLLSILMGASGLVSSAGNIYGAVTGGSTGQGAAGIGRGAGGMSSGLGGAGSYF